MNREARMAYRPLASAAPDRPTLMTEAEACAYVRVFDNRKHPVRQFADWARRSGVPVKRVGRSRVYDGRVLDAFLEQKPWTRRHRNA
jgi:hypothetical protein